MEKEEGFASIVNSFWQATFDKLTEAQDAFHIGVEDVNKVVNVEAL
jgi:hypothetical protein